MLYWCGFSILWKLDVALLLGLAMHLGAQRKNPITCGVPLYWFISYMGSLLLISYLGSFGGKGILQFPLDILCILPYSIFFLYFSQVSLIDASGEETAMENDGLAAEVIA